MNSNLKNYKSAWIRFCLSLFYFQTVHLIFTIALRGPVQMPLRQRRSLFGETQGQRSITRIGRREILITADLKEY